MTELVFCKLGGSVITRKAEPETARRDVLERLAGELSRSLARRPDLQLVLGHGSGSFGHVVARRYGTRHGVHSEREWLGFVEVAAAASRLNRVVTDCLLAAGVPVWPLPPSASARCRDGRLKSLAVAPARVALEHGLVPLVYGDVALDDTLGGTIVSTEQVLSYLARRLRPSRLILVTAVGGVFTGDPVRDPSAQQFPEISPANWAAVRTALGGSHATDVTGGMASKVTLMVSLVRALPGLTVHIVSGERPGALEALLCDPVAASSGTLIRWKAGMISS